MAGALMAAASCNKIEEISSSLGRTVITGVAESIGSGTKADMAYYYEVIWRENDKIYVTNGTDDDTFTLSGGKDTSKGQFTEDHDKGIKGDIQAFYPGSLKTDAGYVWPSVQSKDQTAPMYASQTITGEEGETVNFSSLGSVLQIVFNSTTPNITLASIKIQDAAKAISGPFTVSDSGLAVIDDGAENTGITLDLGDGVEMGSSAKYFHFSVPAGKYEDLTITFTTTNGRECVLTSSAFPEVEANKVCRVTLSGEFKPTSPEGGLNGKFTVNANGKQVYFSRGNLQATYQSNGSYSWGFAEHQYDVIGGSYYGQGTDTGNNTIDNQTEGAKVDLFGWSTMMTYFGISSAKDDRKYDGDFEDWGSAIDFEGTWRTLSHEEWAYLLGDNSEREGKWKNRVKVNGIYGLVIAPDNFSGTIEATYDAETWVAAEEAGLVFLPDAGFRFAGDGDKPTVGNFDMLGYYWSSTGHGDGSAYYLCIYGPAFSYSDIDPDNADNRSAGRSVRLVSDVQDSDSDGSLNGLFSVKADCKVYFSRGNLQATYKGNNFYGWSFAEHQYDVIGGSYYGKGTDTGNNTIDNPSRGDKVDLFGWSTSATYFGIASSKNDMDYDGEFVDWGTAIDKKGTWRTLSHEEWAYLFGDSARRKGKWRSPVNINGIYGVVIAPDNFSGNIEETYDAAAWVAAEQAGLVFLPDAGFRFAGDGDKPTVGNFNKIGYYWSSTDHGEGSAFYLSIYGPSMSSPGQVDPDNADNRSAGRSVRLVKEQK